MKVIVFVALFAFASCHPADRVKELLKSLRDDDVETLRKETEALIKTTETEMKLLRNLAQSNVLQSLDSINENLDIILIAAGNRTSDLLNYLTEKIESTSQIYPDDAKTTCLILDSYLNELQTPLENRIKLSLETATRVANATVRDDIMFMDDKFLELDALTKLLEDCGDDYECVVKLSEESVQYNTEFINSFNDILVNVASIPEKIIQQAVGDVTSTLFVNEDYACNTADITLNCLKSFDDEVGGSTTQAPTGTTPVPALEDATTDEAPTTTSSPTTPQPENYCNHEPFNPAVDI